MNTLSYHIVIRTPAGYRIGDISVEIDDDGHISGTIQAPSFEQHFDGVLNDDSTMWLNFIVNKDGMAERCESTGRISSSAIHISVPSAGFTFDIDGTAARAKLN